MSRKGLEMHKFIKNMLSFILLAIAGISMADTKGQSDIASDTLRSDLNGKLIKYPGTDPVYLVLDGQKSHVPNPPTYNNLFKAWSCIQETTATASILTGPPLSNMSYLIKASNNPIVYFVTNGLKRGIPNPVIFNAYCFNRKKIQTVSPEIVGTIETGPNITPSTTAVLRNDLNGQLVQKQGNPAVYLVLDGRKSHVPNPPTYNNLFQTWSCIKKTTNTTSILTGPTISNMAYLIKASNDLTVYFVTAGQKRGIPNPDTFNAYCFNWNKIQTVSPEIVDTIETGPIITSTAVLRNDLNGKLVKYPGTPAVYLVLDGKKSHVPNPPTYNKLFKAWNCIKETRTTASILTGPPISNMAYLIKASNNPTVYFVTNGQKRGIPNPETFNAYCFDWNKIQISSPEIVNTIVNGPIITKT